MHGTYFNATIAVYVTLNLRLGKDEVGGANPPSSSNIFRLNRKVLADFAIFLQLLTTFLRPQKDLVAENRRFAN